MSSTPASKDPPKLSPAKKALLEKWSRGQVMAAAPTIPRRPPDAIVEPSFRQLGMWLVEQLETGNPINNQAFCVRITGDLDDGLLERSLNQMIRRHEVLRTRYSQDGGAPTAVVEPDAPISLPFVDLRTSGEQSMALLLQGVVAELKQPFDLERPPLVRGRLFGLPGGEHALLLVFHHMAFDGWSSGVVGREVVEHYSALRSGRAAQLPELPIQFADFAHWQREQTRGGAFQAALDYWRGRLTPLPPALDLPTDRPRPSVRRVERRAHRVVYPAPLLDRLKSLSRQEDATLFATMLAAFQLLLGRLTGQTDFAVGAPAANRGLPETHGLIGPCFNMVTVRADLASVSTFRELLAQAKQETAGVFANQHVPIEVVVEHVRPTRPLYATSFALQNFPFPRSVEGALKLTPLAMDSEALQFGGTHLDLAVALLEADNTLTGYFEYDPDLFDDETVARMAAQYRTLLESIVARPDGRLWELALLPAQERERLLVDGRGTARALPEHLGLHQLFEAQAARTPNAVALLSEAGTWTYRELNGRANQLARHLRSRGVGPDVRVGLCVERSLEMVVGMLGILKAGGGYVPLDPSYPGDRLAFMLADSKSALLLTQESLLGRVRAGDHVKIERLDADWAQIAKHDDANLEGEIDAEQVAYVIYTSGSTGRPKGVQIPHRAIVNHMLWMQRAFPLTEGDCVLQKTPFSFDASVWEFYAPLFSGARLVLTRPDGERDCAHLSRLIIDHGVTVLQLVPTLLRMLLLEDSFGRCTSLKRVFCGGEALPVELVRAFSSRLDAQLINLYGPTEAAIDTTAWVCPALEASSTVRIGQPVDNAQVYVLDRQMQLVPLGVAGELYIGGAGLARGYLDRPELTAAQFLPDPFSPTPGERIYKTGDLARFRSDGTLEFLGRIDHQVKLRGYRIELGEIEAAIAEHPAVREAAVLDVEHAPGEGRLVAYVVPADATEFSVAELRSFVADKLPSYMVPSTFLPLASLPLTPSGKVDRSALRQRPDTRPTVETAHVPANTEMERMLVRIWQEVLGLERIGVNDNFFELGGQSLTLVRAHKAIREVCPIELSVVDMFRFPTIRALAAHLSASAGAEHSFRDESDRGERRREALARARRRGAK